MVELKLAKLPDRTPVKMMITINPDLSKSLAQYAEAYSEVHGPEPVSELVPYMLQCFLDSDRAFVRAQKKRHRENGTLDADALRRTPRRTRGTETAA